MRQALQLEPLEDRTMMACIPLNDIEPMHSNLAATKTLYLDFITPTFDSDGDGFRFCDDEQDSIKEIWERVSEDFAPFDIDVTTVNPGGFPHNPVALQVFIGGYPNFRPDPPPKGSHGGWADMDSFTTSERNVVGVFDKGGPLAVGHQQFGAQQIAMAVSHFSGHAFGLRDQSLYDSAGRLIDDLHPGISNKLPIMGFGSGRDIWWNGPTDDGPKQFQDDLAKLASVLGYRADDHTGVTPLAYDAGMQRLVGAGIIERTNDADRFSFTVEGTGLLPNGLVPIEVVVNVAGVGPNFDVANLDVGAEIRDMSGNLLVPSDPPDLLNALIDTELAPGDYVLVVKSHGEYGDVGQYTVQLRDLLGPKVIRSSADTGQLQVTFDEPIDADRFTASEVVVQDAAHDTVIRPSDIDVLPSDNSNRKFTIVFPSANLVGLSVEVGPDIIDRFGNSMHQAFAFEDANGPQITGVEFTSQNIRVNFSEPIKPDSFEGNDVVLADPFGFFYITIRDEDIRPVRGSDNTAIDIHVEKFPVSGYQLEIGPRIQDYFGNPMAAAFDEQYFDNVGPEIGLAFASVVPQIGVGPAPLTRGDILLQFNEAVYVDQTSPVDPTSFTKHDVTVTYDPGGPAESQVPVFDVQPYSGAGLPSAPAGRGFLVPFDVVGYGMYQVAIGPSIDDLFGNQLRNNLLQLGGVYTFDFDVDMTTFPSSNPFGEDEELAKLAENPDALVPPLDPIDPGDPPLPDLPRLTATTPSDRNALPSDESVNQPARVAIATGPGAAFSADSSRSADADWTESAVSTKPVTDESLLNDLDVLDWVFARLG